MKLTGNSIPAVVLAQIAIDRCTTECVFKGLEAEARQTSDLAIKGASPILYSHNQVGRDSTVYGHYTVWYIPYM